MASTALPQSRARRRPRQIDLRAVTGIFLLLLAIGGSIAFWNASADTRPVIVATRELPAGTILDLGDLAVAHVRVDDRIYQAAVPAASLPDLVGKQLADQVYAHQLLTNAQISSRPLLHPDRLTFTIPVSPETASGGLLRPGDAVQVLLTTNVGGPNSDTTVVLENATVYDVGYDTQLTVINSARSSDLAGPGDRGSLSSLTLILTADQAIQLAHAKWNGQLDVALLPAAR